MKHLVVGPGGVGYFSLIGAINSLWDNGHLSDLETMCGSSAGALACIVCAVYKFDFKQIVKRSVEVNLTFKTEILHFIKTYGLVNKDFLLSKINSCIPNISFKELFDSTHIKIYINTYCLELKKVLYLSVDTHPDMSIVDAVYMSICVPFIFEPMIYNDYHYIDAGLVEYSPCSIYSTGDDVLVIRLAFKSYYECNNIYDYISHIFNMMLSRRMKYKFETIYINIESKDVYNINISDLQKIKLIIKGYNAIHEIKLFIK